jgi:hypothetical protein
VQVLEKTVSDIRSPAGKRLLGVHHGRAMGCLHPLEESSCLGELEGLFSLGLRLSHPRELGVVSAGLASTIKVVSRFVPVIYKGSLNPKGYIVRELVACPFISHCLLLRMVIRCHGVTTWRRPLVRARNDRRVHC